MEFNNKRSSEDAAERKQLPDRKKQQRVLVLGHQERRHRLFDAGKTERIPEELKRKRADGKRLACNARREESARAENQRHRRQASENNIHTERLWSLGSDSRRLV